MPGTVIGKKMNLGYPGSVSRSIDAVITNKLSTGLIPFGAPVVLKNDNTYAVFGASNVEADFVGIAVREVKQAIDYSTSMSGYADNERTDVLNRGTICIKVNGTPTPNGKVHIKLATGTFEAVADGANTISLANVRFTSGSVDANGVAEVTILNRSM